MSDHAERRSTFVRARAVIASLSGLSRVKFLLALAASSRPRTRVVSHGLLKFLAPGSVISYKYSVAGHTLKRFLRWNDIESDLQSALELAAGDCYRIGRLPRPRFIIDGGANTGMFVLAASARWPDVPIIAFEPVPSNVEAIRSHLRANHVGSNVRLEQAALAGRDEVRQFFVRVANQGSFASEIPTVGSINVSCRALAQYLPRDPNDLKLIKLDIEGAEIEVLDALFANGGTKRTVIIMELHNTPVSRPWIEALARRINYSIEFFQVGSVTAHCQLTSPDLVLPATS